MIGYSDAPRAWWLTRGMARIAGLNLSQAVLDGWLSRDELANIVTRCKICIHSEQCEQWLSQSGRETRLPGFCPNKSAIESLAPEPASAPAPSAPQH